MQCEICNTIRRLGLDPSAHDLWFCSEAHSADLASHSRSALNEFLLKAAMLQRGIYHVLVQASRYLAGTGSHHLPAYRRRYIRLGL